MPRAVVKIQAAPRNTRWTVSRHEQSDLSPQGLEAVAEMQANNLFFDQHEPPLPRYESYDGSQYSGQDYDRTSTASWRPPQAVNGNHIDDYDTPMEQRASYQISLNTHVQEQNRDVVGQHLLYETAMLDSQSFEMLDIAEVDELKKEHVRLNQRIEAANRKLALESKVKDAAQNLQRLYSVSGKSRADTPQSPESPKRVRSGLLGHRGRTSSSGSGSGQPLHQAEDELAMSMRKVEELNNMVKGLLDRRQYVERKLLRHTAAVLAEQSARGAQQQTNGNALTNGHAERHSDNGASSTYSPDEFDGIRDILQGAPPASINGRNLGSIQKVKDEHDQQMTSVQSRLEQLNEQLRYVIGEASRTRGVNLQPEDELQDQSEEAPLRVDHRLDKLESNVHLLEQEQEGVRAHYSRLQDSAHMTVNAVEEQLEGINNRLHHTLLLGSDLQGIETMREPPQATGHGYQQQLQYLSDSLQSMEQVMLQYRAELDNAREASGGASQAIEDAHAKANMHVQKVDEYEATLGGLWDILQSDVISRRPSAVDLDVEERGLPSPGTPLKEDFSLQAFSARVQHLFDRAQSAKEQQDILRRQVQQQRELNGKSDAEKDKQLTDLQGQHDQLANEHGNAQEELTKEMTQRTQAESEASEARLELVNVMNEFEGLKRTVDTRQQERDEMQQHLQVAQGHATTLQEQVESLEAQVSELTDDARVFTVETDAKAKEAEAKHSELSEQLAATTSARETAEQQHADTRKEMESLESELIRLSTELAMAKAELEGAYGSRAQRAKEAQATDVGALHEQNKQIAEQLQRLQGDHDGLRSLHDSLNGEHETLQSNHTDALTQLDAVRSQVVASDRTKNLESELHEMTDAFTELTKESIELEKERHQLEDLIDGLRDRCEALEGQLNDEKVRWLGIKSPTGAAADAGANGREMMSTMILRQEFKKMMRETRAEGVKLLRAEQEHRRQLETELRRLRQANGPLASGTAQPQPPRANGIGSTASSIPT